MKGVILCGGQGREMMPISANTPKCNLILQGIPVFHHIINGLRSAGINEIIVVVSKNGEPIVNYLKKIDSNLKFTVIHQIRDGVEGAIMSVKDEIRDPHFFLAHGDIIAPSRFYEQLMRTFKSGGDGAIAITLKSSISDFGVIQLDNTGYISEVIEHPGEEKTDIGNYIGAGAYIFPQSFFKHLDSNTDKGFDSAINSLIKTGVIFNASIFSEESLWMDLGNPFDLITANNILFSQYNESRISKLAIISPSAQIEGPVIMEAGVKIDHGAVIKGPVFIGKNVYIGTNSLIRDHTSIERNCTIGYSVEITRSHIQPGSKIGRLSFIGDSIIGQNAAIKSGVTVINELQKNTYLDIRGSIFHKSGVIIGPGATIGSNGVLEPLTVIPENGNTSPGIVISDQKHPRIDQILKKRK